MHNVLETFPQNFASAFLIYRIILIIRARGLEGSEVQNYILRLILIKCIEYRGVKAEEGS